jgi:LacI family transcriptional regulator
LREQILSFCEDSGYRLKSRRLTDSIAVGMNMDNRNAKLVYSRLLHGVQGEAGRQGKLTTIEDPDLSDEFMQRLSRVDGLILVERASAESLKRLSNAVPVVTLNEHIDGQHLDSVVSDNRGGARLAVRLLCEQGHRRIAFVGYARDKNKQLLPRWLERSSGYREGCFEFDIDQPEDYILNLSDLSQAPTIEAHLTHWKAQNRLPSAVILMNDYLGPYVYRAAHNLGLKIPGDLSVVGFGNFEICDAMLPQMTSVHQQFEEMGRLAMEMLSGRIASDEVRPARKIVCDVELIERESVARI